MLHFSTWKQVAIILTCLMGLLLVVPNFISKETLAQLAALGAQDRSSTSASTCAAARICCWRWKWRTCARTGSTRCATMRASGCARPRSPSPALGITSNAVQVRLAKAEDADAALKTLRGLIQQTGNLMLGTSITDLEVTKGEGGLIRLTPTEAGLQHRISSAIERRHRDGAPARRRHGHHRAEHRAPGQRAHPGAGAGPAGHRPAQGADRQDGAPDASTRCTPRRAPRKAARRARRPATRSTSPTTRRRVPSSCDETPVVRGDELVDAQPGFDQRTNEPIITFRFNNAGARKFGNFTKEHVGRPFAIVLDDKVISAPVIREPILGGSGQISGNFTVETANAARHPAALGRAAGQAHHRRGAHRRPVAGRRLRSRPASSPASSAASPPSS